MNEDHVRFLVCPTCQTRLTVAERGSVEERCIVEGSLACGSCSATFPIVAGVPRFVGSDNYAESFGLEWSIHSRTQYDSYSGSNVSEQRFFSETRWGRNLHGQTILEVGSGSGRFTEQALSTGALVVSFDYSRSVDANYASNGRSPNVLIVQASVFQMPFTRGSFDKVFCFGVLQHTPDVKSAFLALPQMLKTGGELVIDVYRTSIF